MFSPIGMTRMARRELDGNLAWVPMPDTAIDQNTGLQFPIVNGPGDRGG